MITALYLSGCGAIFWSAFGRLVLMSPRVLLRVRLAFVLLGGAAAFGVLSVPLGHSPDWPEAALTCAYALVLAVTSVRWRSGVPYDYVSRPRARSAWVDHP